MEGTHKDHRVQLLGPQRTTPQKKTTCLRALSKHYQTDSSTKLDYSWNTGTLTNSPEKYLKNKTEVVRNSYR